MGNELLLLLAEPLDVALQGLKAWRALGADELLDVDPEVARRAVALLAGDRVGSSSASRGRTPLSVPLLLAVGLRGVEAGRARAWLEAIHVPDPSVVLDAARDPDGLARAMRAAPAPSELHRVLRGRSDEAVALAGRRAPRMRRGGGSASCAARAWPSPATTSWRRGCRRGRGGRPARRGARAQARRGPGLTRGGARRSAGRGALSGAAASLTRDGRLADRRPRADRALRPGGDHVGIDLGFARALFTTRRGGVSHAPFATLNLGRWTDDDPAAVEENRRRVLALSGADRFAYGRQVHGTVVVRDGGEDVLDADGRRRPDVASRDRPHRRLPSRGARDRWRGRDGPCRVARPRGRDPRGGPRGAARRGARPRRSDHRRDRSERAGAAATRSATRFARPSGFRRRAGARAHRPARRSRASGLDGAGAGVVHDSGLCTMCTDPSLFFSHRRDGPVTGRQGGVAWLSS
jgi:hypothetical protein